MGSCKTDRSEEARERKSVDPFFDASRRDESSELNENETRTNFGHTSSLPLCSRAQSRCLYNHILLSILVGFSVHLFLVFLVTKQPSRYGSVHVHRSLPRPRPLIPLSVSRTPILVSYRPKTPELRSHQVLVSLLLA